MSTEKKPDDVHVITEKDIATEPGIGYPMDLLVLRRENNRLRLERNQERHARELAELTLERQSMPPTLKQRWAKVGKWGALFTLLPAVGAALAQLWPQYAHIFELLTEWAH